MCIRDSLQEAPTLSDHNEAGTDLGQRSHALNASGYGSWPYIVTFELSSDNIVEYGSDSINVEFGNTDDETAIHLGNPNPPANAEVHLTITDPALNIDPTTADIWIFDLSETGSGTTTIFANNGTNTAMTPAELGDMGCSANCILKADSETPLKGDGASGTTDDVTMTESGANTAIFESFDLNGESQIETIEQAVGCLLYTSPSPRDGLLSRMPSSA